MKKIVVFESPGMRERKALERSLRQGDKVIVLEPFCAYHHRGAIRFYPPPWPSYVSKLATAGKVEVIHANELGAENISFAASEKAVTAVEKVYPYFRREHERMINYVVMVFGDSETERIFKKYFCDLLGDFFSLNTLLHRIRDKVGAPFHIHAHADLQIYNFCLQLVKRSGWTFHDHPDVTFLERCKGEGTRTMAKKSILIAAKVFAQAGMSLAAAILKKKKAAQKRKYRYAVTLVAPSRQLRGDRRGPDFLIDGEKITKEEAVVIPLIPLSSDQEKQLEQIGCAVAYLPRIGRFFSNWREWFGLFRLALTEKPFLNGPVVELASLAFFTSFRWQEVLRTIQCDHFISHCDFGSAHIARNSVLKQRGVATWYFTDAVNFGLNFRTDDRTWNRHPFWTYMYYDHFVTWNEDLASYFSKHPGAMENIHVVGCLWAQHVAQVANRDQAVAKLFGLPLKEVAGKMVLIAYSSTYTVNGVTSFLEGIEFARHLERLVHEIPALFVLIKEKKDKDMHLRLDPLRGQELLDEYERLDGHVRATVSSKELDASFVMGIADLIVSFPFTSTTSEALGAGRNAIWHDPFGVYRKTPLARHGKHVTHSYEELRDRVLSLVSEGDADWVVEVEQSPLFDPYRDGRAIDRFRDILLADR